MYLHEVKGSKSIIELPVSWKPIARMRGISCCSGDQLHVLSHDFTKQQFVDDKHESVITWHHHAGIRREENVARIHEEY